ncbi:hypothetical protein ACFWY5_56440 [Nonomuraea sp. NPDC059007]|uniref:hypothetical protein n=1 Tax=Nonomuraea sp. NPDC059007 TaxID=3346692 RepID=UPI0036A7AEA8
MITRTVLLPDLDTEILHVLSRLVELLRTYAAWEDNSEDNTSPLPTLLAGKVALRALRRIWTNVALTQGEYAVTTGHTSRMVSPDGHECLPLRAAVVRQDDLDVLSATAMALNDRGAGDMVAEGLQDCDLFTHGDLAADSARLAALLNLADTPDTELLQRLLSSKGPAADTVFTPSEYEAYLTTITRINRAWSHGRGLRLWLHDGSHTR